MTQRQNEIYSFIVNFFNENGYAPTLEEICAGCYTTSKSYIRETLWKLESMGMVQVADKKHRAIKIIEK